MAENKTSFVLYADQRGQFDKLNDEQAGKLIKHIFSYVNDEDPEGDFITDLAFEPIRTQLKRDLKKWDKTKEGRSKAGKASAEARKNKKEQTLTNSTNVKIVKQNSTNPTVNVNGNVNDNVNDIITYSNYIQIDQEKVFDLEEFFKKNRGIWANDFSTKQNFIFSEMCQKFMEEKSQQVFNDINHIQNSFRIFVGIQLQNNQSNKHTSKIEQAIEGTKEAIGMVQAMDFTEKD